MGNFYDNARAAEAINNLSNALDEYNNTGNLKVSIEDLAIAYYDLLRMVAHLSSILRLQAVNITALTNRISKLEEKNA